MKKHLVTAMGVVALLTSIGNANTITIANTATTGPLNWTYNVTFANSILSTTPPAPAWFTIVDFGAVTPASLAAAAAALPGSPAGSWSTSTALLGPTVPFGLASIGYVNNPAALDVTFTYTGANFSVVGAPTFPITLVSTTSVAPPRPGAYSSQDESSNPPNQASTANGNLLVPIGNAPDGGSTVALFGIALLGVQVLRQKLGAA